MVKGAKIMNRENLLPIGSVVLLKDSNKRIMIVGRLQRQKETGKIWDYSACFYPEGIINPNELFLFNHDQIEVLYFVGFQDKEGVEFQEVINQKRAELGMKNY